MHYTNQDEDDEFGGKFAYDDDLLHYFVIAYPRIADVDVNRLKFDIANYNIDHYTKIDFDIETSAHLAQQLLFNIVSNFVPTVKYCLCEASGRLMGGLWEASGWLLGYVPPKPRGKVKKHVLKRQK